MSQFTGVVQVKKKVLGPENPTDNIVGAVQFEVGVCVIVGVCVLVGVCDTTGVDDGVVVKLVVGVLVGVFAGVLVKVGVGVGVGLTIPGVRVGVGVGVLVGVIVGVKVGVTETGDAAIVTKSILLQLFGAAAPNGAPAKEEYKVYVQEPATFCKI
jgi:hypothetical protein